MYRVTIRYYEELNEFLPKSMRKKETECEFPQRRSVKDLIESFGVPHTEVDLILVNGTSVDFSYLVKDGDRVSVYPVFESLPIQGVTRLRARPLREPKFVCDVHLRKLAKLLRLLGLDVHFDLQATDQTLVQISNSEKRILLTCDRRLLMRNDISRGFYVYSRQPSLQVKEVLDRFHLRGECRPFTRCLLCNGALKAVNSGDEAFTSVQAEVPPGVQVWCRCYHLCTACGKVYWQGSHYEKLEQKVDALLSDT